MMGRMGRSCLQSLLKLVNSIMGFLGVATFLYSLWMIRVWCREGHPFWPFADDSDSDSNQPWFIYTLLGLGVTLCLITCSGHIAAETANGPCLSCYMVLTFLLVMLEAAIVADVFLNRNWEEDFPPDPTGKLNELKNFIRSNFDISKWIGIAIVTAQGLSIFLAMILRALGPYRGSYYESDEEYLPARLPLLRNQVPQNPYVVDPNVPHKNDAWSTSI